MDKVPILYVYLYRNLKNGLNKTRIDTKEGVKALKKVVHTAPAFVYEIIFNELSSYGFLRRINRRNYIVITNKKNDNQLKRLREYVFPFNPNN